MGALLPGALAGEYVLAPAPDAATVSLLNPQLPVEEADAGVIITTSGSTGTPKAVVLSARAIVSAADAFRQRYGAFTWTCVLPTHHVAGLMVLARAHLDRAQGGCGVLMATPDLSGPDPRRGHNAISLVPTQLVRVLRSAALTARLASFNAVLVGGAAMPSAMLAQAREAGVTVLTSYGMSETCGGCVFDGLPLPGVLVDIDVQGRVSIGGPMVFSGYRGDAAATASTLIDGHLLTNDRGEWVPSPDGQARLRVLGRLDDVVISGGVNVDLAAVQRAVDAVGHPEVAVVSVPDQEWGARIVLATTHAEADLSWWRDALRPVLGPAGLPRQLLIVKALPRTDSGKLDRQQLQSLASAAQS